MHGQFMIGDTVIVSRVVTKVNNNLMYWVIFVYMPKIRDLGLCIVKGVNY